MPHFVRIELAYPQGWWTAADHARLVDPEKYASTMLARPGKQSGTVIGVRITDHDDGTVWTVGQAPDVDKAIGGMLDPKPGARGWSDLLGEVDDDPAPASTTWEDLL